MINRVSILLTFLMTTAISTHAATIGLTFSGGANTTTVVNSTRGWAFTANAGISVNALGLWDITPADPLGEAHELGLWTIGGSLLASTLVPVDAPLTGQFRFSTLAVPVDLVAGNTYVVGAVYNTAADIYRTSVTGTNIVTAPQITYTGGQDAINTTGSLTFPTTSSGVGRAFGPNILFDVAVPEPSSWLLLCAGLAVFALRWRSRVRTSV